MSKGPGKLFQKPVRFLKGIETMARERLAICHQCEHWDKQFGRCKLCGCILKAKARVPSSRCPANKWPVL